MKTRLSDFISESRGCERIVGYHGTDDISWIAEGFDLRHAKTTFLGRGFSFSRTPDDVIRREHTLRCEICLTMPLMSEDVWRGYVDTVDGASDLRSAWDDMAKAMLADGYDVVLAFREFGWWKDAPRRSDEIVVLDVAAIKNIEVIK